MTKTKRAKSKKPAQKEDPDLDRTNIARKELSTTHDASNAHSSGVDSPNRRSPRLKLPKKIARSAITESNTAKDKEPKGTKRKRDNTTANKAPPSKRQKTTSETVVRIDLLDESPRAEQNGSKKNSANVASQKNKKQGAKDIHNGTESDHEAKQSRERVAVKKSVGVTTARQSPIKQRKPKSSISVSRKAVQRKAKSKTVRKRPGKPKRVLPKLSTKKSVQHEEESAESDQIDNKEQLSSSESSSSKSSSSKSSSKSSKASKIVSSHKSSNKSNRDSESEDNSHTSKSKSSSASKSSSSKSDKRSSAEKLSDSSASKSNEKTNRSHSSHSSKKSKSLSEQSSEASDKSSEKSESEVKPAKTNQRGVKSKAGTKTVPNATKTKSVKSLESGRTKKASIGNGKAARGRATKKKNEDSERDSENARLERLDNEISQFMPLLVSIMSGKKQTPRAKQWNLGLKARSQMHYKVHMGGFESGEVDDILSIVQRKIMKMQVPDSVQRGGVSHFILDVLWPELAVLLLAARKSVSKKEAEQLFTADNDLEDEWIKTLKQSPERKAPIVILD